MEDQEKHQDDGLIRRTYSLGFSQKSLDLELRSIDFVFSDDSIDSYDEIVEQDWDLTRYRKNPVILYDHNKATRYGGIDPKHSLPIGRAENVRVEDGKLQGRVFLATAAANPLAEQCWRLILEDMLRAGSVGFVPGDVFEERRDGKEVFRLRKNNLFEFSLTPIGANENALANSAYSERDLMLLRSYAKRALVINTTPPLGGNEGNNMDIKELQAEVDRLNTSVASLEKRANNAETELETLRSKNKELSDRNTELEGELIASEVVPLVGKKISPAQKEKFVKLRVEWGKEEFDEFVKAMPELPHTKTITDDNASSATNTATGRKSGQPKVLAAALRAAEKAAGEDVTVDG